MGGRSRRGTFFPTRSVLSAAGKVARVKIGNVQEAVLPFAEINERRLNRGLDVHHAALVNVADICRVRDAFGIQLFQPAGCRIDERNAALFAGHIIHDHEQIGAGRAFCAWLSSFSFWLFWLTIFWSSFSSLFEPPGVTSVTAVRSLPVGIGC